MIYYSIWLNQGTLCLSVCIIFARDEGATAYLGGATAYLVGRWEDEFKNKTNN